MENRKKNGIKFIEFELKICGVLTVLNRTKTSKFENGSDHDFFQNQRKFIYYIKE